LLRRSPNTPSNNNSNTTTRNSNNNNASLLLLDPEPSTESDASNRVLPRRLRILDAPAANNTNNNNANRRTSFQDDPPSLISMEEPSSSLYLTNNHYDYDNMSSQQLSLQDEEEEDDDFSSSELTVNQSNNNNNHYRGVEETTGSNLQKQQQLNDEESDRSLQVVPGVEHYEGKDQTRETNSPVQSASPQSSPSPRTPQHDNNHNNSNNSFATPEDGSTLFQYYSRRASAGSLASGTTSMSECSDDHTEEFLEQAEESMNHQNDNGNNNNVLADTDDFYVPADSLWMGRSIETLLLGFVSVAPILRLQDETHSASFGDYQHQQQNHVDDYNNNAADFSASRRRSTASTFGGFGRRRSSQGSFPDGRRGSLSLSGNNGQGHGGTLAVYYRRRGQPTSQMEVVDRQGRRGSASHTPMFRRRSSMAASGGSGGDDEGAASSMTSKHAGPNACLSIMGRESTGKSLFSRGMSVTESLRAIGGHTLYSRVDKPAAGIVNEVAFLAAAIDSGDWAETQAVITRLAPRLLGDPMGLHNGAAMDPNLPPTAPKFYAGGGRVGLERDAFVLADGMAFIIKVFWEKSFVGQEMAQSLDARDLSSEIVATRLAPCWNEALAILRELVFSIPSLVTCSRIDGGKFLPFLFTLLVHDSTFDAAAALIEEILAILSQSPQQPVANEMDDTMFQPIGRVSPPTTFFLGNVPKLYELWNGFNCRQLAHFCRVLALLVFEPEDRQLLESPAVLKSLELLRLRRTRARRAGRDATVDLNQSILLGDDELISKLLKLLKVMNFAPSLHNIQPFHVMAQFPFIADTLVMLGLGEIDSWDEIDRQEHLARRMQEEFDGEEPPLLSDLGSVSVMLQNLGETLGEPSNQIGSIIQVISAAQQAGVIVGRSRNRLGSRSTALDRNPSAEDQATAEAALRLGGMPMDTGTIQGLASVAGILSDQMLVRRLYEDEEPSARHFISTPEDAANSLQFNGILLGSYQVEVLFVICTLLGGRRKIDTQNKIVEIVPVLEEMFDRLPFANHRNDETDGSRVPDSASGRGVHGPGCECTPESALCVQFLRLVHNFCDRDVDNYSGRQLLLSQDEIAVIAGARSKDDELSVSPGLLSKIAEAFMRESDESPYRFWLASCIESFLRGSSPKEQVFVAKSGLLEHLVDEISSVKLHCAGNLQTSFDILGELAKGNPHVVRMMMSVLDESRFRKLFSVATSNLVDSNVFIRSLILTVERLASEQNEAWTCRTDNSAYLTHSWMEIAAFDDTHEPFTLHWDKDSLSPVSPDWFPPFSVPSPSRVGDDDFNCDPGWIFKPTDSESASLLAPNTIQRLAWFLEINKVTLLRDLMQVVSLQNINHENICALNTAIVVVIFAHRRRQLKTLLETFRHYHQNEDIVSRFANLDLSDRHQQSDLMRNFREVLWFWKEYYTHRGRDRLSLEFSSHVRFQEWNNVVSLLTADDGSPTSLVAAPIRLPRSPYQRAARGVVDDVFLRAA
jgi:hypothetical protein